MDVSGEEIASINEFGEKAVVENVLQKLSEKNETAPSICDLSGFGWYEVDTAEDLKIAEEGLKNNKHFLPAYIMLSEVYQKQDKPDDAYAILKKGYDHNPHIILLKSLEGLSLKLKKPQKKVVNPKKRLGFGTAQSI